MCLEAKLPIFILYKRKYKDIFRHDFLTFVT